MAKLSTAAAVRERCGYDDIPTFNDAFDAALESATPELERLLRTEFTREDRVDLFLPRYCLSVGAVPRHDLALKAGFLTDGAVTVTYASTIEGLSDSGVSEASNVSVDREKGLVSLRGADLTGNLIKVSYTSGFTVTTGVFQSVPAWLAAVAEEMCLIIVDRTNPSLRGDSAKNAMDRNATHKALINSMQQKIRYFAHADRPI